MQFGPKQNQTLQNIVIDHHSHPVYPAADWHRDEVLWPHHPVDQQHAAGRLPLPHHLLRHHGRIRLRSLIHIQHGLR